MRLTSTASHAIVMLLLLLSGRTSGSAKLEKQKSLSSMSPFKLNPCIGRDDVVAKIRSSSVRYSSQIPQCSSLRIPKPPKSSQSSHQYAETQNSKNNQKPCQNEHQHANTETSKKNKKSLGKFCCASGCTGGPPKQPDAECSTAKQDAAECSTADGNVSVIKRLLRFPRSRSVTGNLSSVDMTAREDHSAYATANEANSSDEELPAIETRNARDLLGKMPRLNAPDQDGRRTRRGRSKGWKDLPLKTSNDSEDEYYSCAEELDVASTPRSSHPLPGWAREYQEMNNVAELKKKWAKQIDCLRKVVDADAKQHGQVLGSFEELYRFLCGNQFELSLAQNALAKAIQWRKEFPNQEIFQILCDAKKSENFFNQPDHVCSCRVKHYSRDLAGNNVVFLRVSPLLKALTTEKKLPCDMSVFSVAKMAFELNKLSQEQNIICRATWVVDMTDINVVALVNLGVRLRKVIPIFSHFPEQVHYILIVNNPKSMAARFFERIADKAKLKFIGNLAELENYIAKDQIPKEYGGTCCRPFELTDSVNPKSSA